MKKISVRLWMQMLLLIGITLGILWFFQVVMLEKYYLYSQTRNIKKEGLELAAAYVKDSDPQQLDRDVEELNLKYNAGVEIYSTGGDRIYGYAFMPMMAGRGMDKQEVFDESAKGATVVKQVKHNRLNSNILLIGIPIGSKGTVTEVMIISTPLAAIKEAEAIIKEQLIVVTLILVIVSLVLTFYFSRAFTRPILKINEAAAKMAAGNLSITVEVESEDELGMLAGTINNLSIQLQKIEQLRKELIANVSHEFRTPLSLIKGYTETIRDITGDIPEKRSRQLAIILEETDRLKSMVDDTLNLSQMQSEYFKLDIKAFNIAATVRNIINRFSYMVEEKGINLELETEKKNITVFGDEARIEQVLYNFVNNACNHTGTAGRIRIGITENANNVKIEVMDNGEGIQEEQLPYIWDRFYKASDESRGTGLGLAIAKKILEAHGNGFGVESEMKKGTCFWFILKKADEHA